MEKTASQLCAEAATVIAALRAEKTALLQKVASYEHEAEIAHYVREQLLAADELDAVEAYRQKIASLTDPSVNLDSVKVAMRVVATGATGPMFKVAGEEDAVPSSVDRFTAMLNS